MATATPTKREIEAAFGQRVYEYVDNDGVVYYSFTRHPVKISLVKRLTLSSRLGVHISNHILMLRRLGMSLGIDDTEVQ